MRLKAEPRGPLGSSGKRGVKMESCDFGPALGSVVEMRWRRCGEGGCGLGGQGPGTLERTTSREAVRASEIPSGWGSS